MLRSPNQVVVKRLQTLAYLGAVSKVQHLQLQIIVRYRGWGGSGTIWHVRFLQLLMCGE
jgi:hypothetical protein